MKKKRVLKTGFILLTFIICVVVASQKNQSIEFSLLDNNIEALANGENPNPSCQTGAGMCSYQDKIYPGILKH